MLPWVLCMALRFEFWASKPLSTWVVCLKSSTCWKDLNRVYRISKFEKNTYCIFIPFSWSSSNSRVSKAWLEMLGKLEVEVWDGKLWMISSKIAAFFRSDLTIKPTSSSWDNALVTALRNGVKLLLRATKFAESSCGWNVSQSHSFYYEQKVITSWTFGI